MIEYMCNVEKKKYIILLFVIIFKNIFNYQKVISIIAYETYKNNKSNITLIL